MDVKIRFTVCCFLCGNMDVDPEQLRGMLINRRLSIMSDIVTAKNQISQLSAKEINEKIQLELRISKLENELEELNHVG